MIKKLLFFLAPGLLAVASLIGCSRAEVEFDAETQVKVYDEIYPASIFQAGKVSIKVSDELVKELEANTDENGMVIPAQVKSMTSTLAQLGNVRMERIFEHAGRFEPRTREAGLHKWYYVYFDEEIALTKAGDDLKAIKGIELVEYNPRIARPQYTKVQEVEGDENLPQIEQTADMPFDDPRLGNQWHYYNNGSRYYSEAGSDINIFPVWQAGVTGNQEVIVSIVDGGIDYAHEDLADNMWHNPQQSGDRVYGYNFVNGENGYQIYADDHGTHVAGTVAAVNNNGKGVCGVAGGNFAAGIPGVRLMSCQIFHGDKAGDGARAIKWGADHGAVISQNSWGYVYDPQRPITAVPQYDKDAIDYFIKYAGYDENGNQEGPMAGGVVIFAAGNDDQPHGYPAEYEPAIAVAAIDAEFERAYYSNYGPWVDISATGGDSYDNNEVWSTTPNNKYAAYQGTSMACPHVSGIAALVISNMGGPGFTNTQLRQILIDSFRNIDDHNPSFIGKLGTGLINAELAVMGGGGEAPEQISDLYLETQSNNILFNLTVPRDPDSGKPVKVRIYYSKTSFENIDYTSAEYQEFEVGSVAAGSEMNGIVTGLEFSTEYYVVATALDYNKQESVPSVAQLVNTGINHAPTINPDSEINVTVEKAISESKNVELNIYDIDGHSLSYSIEPQMSGITLSLNPGQEVVSYLTFNSSAMEEGTHTGKVVITDAYDMSTSVNFTVTVEGNEAPTLIKPIENIKFKSDKDQAATIVLAEYVSDEDLSTAMVKVTPSIRGVANATFNNGNIVVSPTGAGFVDIEVIVTDAAGEKLTTSFQVAVMSESTQYTAYPNPVVDNLYIRSAEDINATVSIISVNGQVVYKGEHQIGTFSPAIIDMTSVYAGIYTLVVKSDKGEYQQNIVKQ